MINMNFAALVLASLLLLQVGFAAAGSSHHHHNKNKKHNIKNKKITERRICKDRAEVHCRLIAEDRDCGKFNTYGESYGDMVCPVSCGKCEEVPDEIFTDQQCYQFAKQVIDVRFSNSMPHIEDWVGIYPDTADSNDLGTPVAWFWLCGDKKHKCRTSVGSVTFPWLPPGNYKAIMSRNRNAVGPYVNYGPYASHAESQPFEIQRGDKCTSRRRAEAGDAEGMVQSSLRGTQQ